MIIEIIDTDFAPSTPDWAKTQSSLNRARHLENIEKMIKNDAKIVSDIVGQIRFVPDKPVKTEWKVPFKTDAWRNRFRSGAIIMNPYTVGNVETIVGTLYYATVRTYREVHSTSYYRTTDVVVERKSATLRSIKVGIPPVVFSEFLKTGLGDDAVNAAYAEAYTGATDVLVELAELPETLLLTKQLKATLGNMRKLDANLKELRRREGQSKAFYENLLKKKSAHLRPSNFDKQISKAENHLKQVRKRNRAKTAQQLNPFKKGSTAALLVDSWMLWRFAIRPLILSAESISKDLAHKRRFYGSFSKVRSAKDSLRLESQSGEIQLVQIVNVDQRAVGHVRVRGQEAFGSKIQTFSANPMLAVWERIPYSWALDRFVHIGNTLAGLMKPANLRESAGCLSFKIKVDSFVYANARKIERELSYSVINPTDHSRKVVKYTEVTQVVVPSGKLATARGESFERTLRSGVTLPSFNHSTWTLAKAADLIGLLTQLTRK